jgi:hypothetical protein
MTPVLQALIALAIGILFRLLLLSKMSLAVRHNLSHMIDIILVVFAGILLGIFFQDSNDFAAGVVADGLS